MTPFMLVLPSTGRRCSDVNNHEDLIGEAESWVAHTKPSVVGAILRDMISALESVRAERDAALARIAELKEAMKRMKVQRRANGRRAQQAESRIAEAAKLHRKYTYYDLEDSCPDTTDEHREEHHHEASDDIGEFYCDQMPTGDVCCDICRDVNGDRLEWPCSTAVSLGMNEGEEKP